MMLQPPAPEVGRPLALGSRTDEADEADELGLLPRGLVPADLWKRAVARIVDLLALLVASLAWCALLGDRFTRWRVHGSREVRASTPLGLLVLAGSVMRAGPRLQGFHDEAAGTVVVDVGELY